MALGASVYKLVFDTQGLESVTASRRELALSKKIMEETTPAVDKLAVAQANLDRLVQKDLISHEQRNQALAKVREELSGETEAVSKFNTEHLNGIPVVGKFASTLSTLGPIGVGVATAVGGVTLATKLMGAAVSSTVDNVSKQIAKIDELIAASETIDISAGRFQRLAHAADLSNIEQSKLSAGMEKMMANTSKAADGNKKLAASFDIIGLDARALRNSNPDDAFVKITRALNEVPNAADRARESTAIFGSADFLRFDTSGIERANKLLDELGGGLSLADEAAFGRMDNSVKDLNLSLDATWQKVTMAIVPAIEVLATKATRELVTVNQQYGDAIERAGDRLTSLAIVASEMKWAPHPHEVELLKDLASTLTGIPLKFIPESRELGELDAALREGRRLDEQIANSKFSRDVGADQERLQEIDDEVGALDELLEKLREEAATRGMSTAHAKLWKIEQMGARDETILQARAYAAEADELEKVAKAKQAIESFTESLRLQGETSAESARRLAELKLANDGVDEATRKSLMAQFDASEAQKLAIENQKKAAAEAKKHADAVEALRESIDKQEAKLTGYNAAIGKHEDRTRAGERAVLAWQLANDKAGATVTAEILKHFDAATALEKRQKATEAATKAQEELQKLIRQAGMTDQQKQLDDLKEAGVNDEQLKIVATLQKEAALRGAIRQEITATSSALKAGSRETADAFAKANQFAVRQAFTQRAVGAPAVVEKQQTSRESPSPPHSVVPSLRDPRLEMDRVAAIKADLQSRLNEARQKDPFEDQAIRARLMSQSNERMIRQSEIRDEFNALSASRRESKALEMADVREALANRLNATTATPTPAVPMIAGSQPASQQNKEQLKETQRTNQLLGKLVEKTVPLQVEEVTL